MLLLYAICSDNKGGNGGDFVAGFLVGGAIFGTLAYVFAPQVRMYYVSSYLFYVQYSKLVL